MKLILVDDHPMVLQGVSSVVNSQKDMKVVGTASNIEEGLRLLRELHPDLAVVDLRIGNDYGLDPSSRAANCSQLSFHRPHVLQ